MEEPHIESYRDDADGGVAANCKIDMRFGHCSATIRISRDWFRPNRYMLVGDRGWIRWAPTDGETLEYGPAGSNVGARLTVHACRDEQGERRLGARAPDFLGAVHEHLRHTVRAVRQGERVLNAADALETLRLVDHCRTVRQPMAQSWMRIGRSEAHTSELQSLMRI